MVDTRKGTSFATWHRQNREKLLARTTTERAFPRYLAALGLRFREQQGFYTPFYRIADFYLPEQNLIIEINGRLSPKRRRLSITARTNGSLPRAASRRFD